MDLSERQAASATRHPWEQARARFFERLVDDIIHPGAPIAWLDVGAGDAWLGMQIADSLPPGSSMVCWDINYTADDIESLEASAQDVRFTAQQPTDRADVISLLDVLEHVEDDVGLLGLLVEQNLAPNGVVIVSVPAYQRLFTSHDTALAHHRRYSPDQCRAVIRSCGLRIDQDGGLFSSLLGPRTAQAALERVRTSPAVEQAGVGGWSGGPVITKAMTSVLNADAAASRWMSGRGWLLPGLSYWAVCRRAGS